MAWHRFRRQTIIWTNDDLISWRRLYCSLLSELSWERKFSDHEDAGVRVHNTNRNFSREGSFFYNANYYLPTIARHTYYRFKTKSPINWDDSMCMWHPRIVRGHTDRNKTNVERIDYKRSAQPWARFDVILEVPRSHRLFDKKPSDYQKHI